jgi:hypothetical protein
MWSADFRRRVRVVADVSVALIICEDNDNVRLICTHDDAWQAKKTKKCYLFHSSMDRGHVFSSLSTRIGKGADLFQAARELRIIRYDMVDQAAASLPVRFIFVFFYFSFLSFLHA